MSAARRFREEEPSRAGVPVVPRPPLSRGRPIPPRASPTHVADAEPANASASKGYAERKIHSEMYNRHPHVHAAVHSYSEAVVPYSIAGVPLRACCHMAAFIGASGAQVFDIGDHYHSDDAPDMLVRSGRRSSKMFR